MSDKGESYRETNDWFERDGLTLGSRGSDEEYCEVFSEDDNEYSHDLTLCSSHSAIPTSSQYWEYSLSSRPNSSKDASVFLSDGFVELPKHVKSIRLGVSMSRPLEEYANKSKLKIFCYLNHLEKQMGLYIKSVTCSYEQNRILELKRSGEEDFLGGELLTAEILQSIPADHLQTLTFRFYVIGSVDSYPFQRCDIRMGKQLWTAAKDTQLTDVEFIVGDRSFWAHKFILAARSPVLKAMFGADMIESRTGRVSIDDADPDTFQQFLYFVYTGQLHGEVSSELEYVAEKYNVQTLSAICQRSNVIAGEEKNAEERFASVSSAKAGSDDYQGKEEHFWSNSNNR